MPAEKLQSLLKIVRNRGVLTNDDVVAFYSTSYDKQQLLENILGVSQKV